MAVVHNTGRYRLYLLSREGYQRGSDILDELPGNAQIYRELGRLGAEALLSAARGGDLQPLSRNEGEERLQRMTVVVAFYCIDGVVIAADSMITPSMGGIGVGHHHGRKIEVLPGPQLFAFAGDQGQAGRFKIMAEHYHSQIGGLSHALEYGLGMSLGIVEQLRNTGITGNAIGANTILAYCHGGAHHCCMFEGQLQPRLLDQHHYYAALGTGKLAADPFLRFLVDVFYPNGQPTVPEATFLAIWTVQHAIDTNPGGVAGPIRIATFIKDQAGNFQAIRRRHAAAEPGKRTGGFELPDSEIQEHQQAIESAAHALHDWRDQLQSGDAADNAPAVPELLLPEKG